MYDVAFDAISAAECSRLQVSLRRMAAKYGLSKGSSCRSKSLTSVAAQSSNTNLRMDQCQEMTTVFQGMYADTMKYEYLTDPPAITTKIS